VRKWTRLAVGLASLTLALLYVLPLWRITLEAPQYPEGLGMEIHINTIVGQKPHDLRNINNLNHYIGMKSIDPEAIPELAVMPYLVGLLILTGLLAAATGKRWLLFTWFGLFVLFSVAGLVDFWWWEYDYGHNLDPTAAIKIPGMSYQPPLIGSKRLLNFRAHSWPAAGGIAAALAGLVGAVAVFVELRRKGRES